MLFLREHAGTLYFTREYACRHFHANKDVFSFDSFFPAVFAYVLLQFWHSKTKKNRVNASAKAKVASRCRFGGLLADFSPPGRALLSSLGRPEALLGRFWAALGVKKEKIAPSQNSILAPGAPIRLRGSKKTSSRTILCGFS